MENQVFVIIPPRSDSLFGQGCAQGYADVKVPNATLSEFECRYGVLMVLYWCRAFSKIGVHQKCTPCVTGAVGVRPLKI